MTWEKWPDDPDSNVRRRTHRVRGRRGVDRSDLCNEHETVPGWMRILWARAAGLLAARWGINTG